MFAFICAFNQLKNPLLLYEDFKESMTEDYRQNNCSEEVAESLALTDIESILKTQRLTLSQLGLPNPVLALADSDEAVNLENERKKPATCPLYRWGNFDVVLFFCDVY